MKASFHTKVPSPWIRFIVGYFIIADLRMLRMNDAVKFVFRSFYGVDFERLGARALFLRCTTTFKDEDGSHGCSYDVSTAAASLCRRNDPADVSEFSVDRGI